jgi:hypothetical protein
MNRKQIVEELERNAKNILDIERSLIDAHRKIDSLGGVMKDFASDLDEVKKFVGFNDRGFIEYMAKTCGMNLRSQNDNINDLRDDLGLLYSYLEVEKKETPKTTKLVKSKK